MNSLPYAQARRFIPPGAGRIWRANIDLAACLEIAKRLRVDFLLQKACICGQPRQVVGGSLGFFERGFLQGSVNIV
jgi:hypothetical protein